MLHLYLRFHHLQVRGRHWTPTANNQARDLPGKWWKCLPERKRSDDLIFCMMNVFPLQLNDHIDHVWLGYDVIGLGKIVHNQAAVHSHFLDGSFFRVKKDSLSPVLFYFWLGVTDGLDAILRGRIRPR